MRTHRKFFIAEIARFHYNDMRGGDRMSEGRYSASAYEATKRYKKKKIRRVSLEMQIEDYDTLKAAADKLQEPVNTFIKAAIGDRIQKLREENQI